MITMNTRTVLGAALSLCAASATATTFYPLMQFPEPAAGAFSVTAEALADGRFLVWNGDTLFEQTSPNADAFTPVASGYAGDPGFIASTPSGGTMVLGGGFGGQIYVLDPNAIVDFTPAVQVATISHYDGLMLTDSVLLVDAGKSDFSGSELIAADLFAKSGAQFRRVAAKPDAAKAEVVLDKPPFSFSGTLAIDRNAGVVYVMDSNTRELRSFSVAALLDAFETGTELDWETDGTPIGAPGDFYSGGVSGIDANGNLIIDGSESFGGPTGVQIVDPATGTVLETLTPNGPSGFYSALYNSVTNAVLLFNLGEVFSTEPVPPPANSPFPAVPPATPAHSAIALMMLGLIGLGMGVARSHRAR